MPASIFNGSAIKILKNILRFKDGREVVSTSTDPIGVGVDSPIGSMLMRSTGQIYKKNSSSTTDWKEIEIADRFNAIQRYGFVDLTETSMSFDSGTYTFTLTSVGATWRYFRNSKLNTITGTKTVTIPGTPPATNRYFIYIDDDSGTLSQSTTSWTLLDTKVPVAIVMFNDTMTPKYLIMEERHQCLIDRRWHYYQHNTVAARLILGSTLSGYNVSPAVPVDTDNTFALSLASIADEDLISTISSVADGDGTTNNYDLMYRTGASSWAWERSPVPFRYTAAGYIQYDNAGTMTQGSAGNFYNWYLLYTNIMGTPGFTWTPGRGSFNSLAAAQASDPTSFDWSGLPIAEFVIAYQVTFKTNNAYGTKGKCRLAADPRRINSNVTAPSVSATGIDHNTLLNRQGGNGSNEYYHLSLSQYNSVIAKNLIKLLWTNDSDYAALEDSSTFGMFRYGFEAGSAALIKTCFRVPPSYVVGTPITLLLKVSSPTGSNTILMTSTSTLIRNDTDALTVTTNQRVSTNTALTMTAANREIATSLDLTLAADGSINGVQVQPNDTILISLYRGSDSNVDVAWIIPAETGVLI